MIAAVMFIILMIFVKSNYETIKVFISDHALPGIIVSFIVYAAFGVLFIPTEPFTLFLGALMNPLYVVFVSAMGNTLSCIIEYYIGKGVHEISDFENKKASLPFHLGKLPVESLCFQVLGRLIPGFGPKIVSIMSGIYHVSFSCFLLISVITNVIGGFILAYGGQVISLLGRK